MYIAILNGPNLSNIGLREPDVYGAQSFEDYITKLRAVYSAHQLSYFQSHCEGALIEELYRVTAAGAVGVVLNAGAYTHTSIAILDAIRAIGVPTIEVHISNIYAREPYRHHSMIAPACRGVIAGLGLEGYRLAIDALLVAAGGLAEQDKTD